MYSRIIGTGRYLPEKILSNQDLEQMVDTTDEWIRERTGIKRRAVNADRCHEVWAENTTACSNCIAACPFSKNRREKSKTCLCGVLADASIASI